MGGIKQYRKLEGDLLQRSEIPDNETENPNTNTKQKQKQN